MFLDPLYMILILPGFLLATYASLKVSRAYKKYSQVPSSSGLTGAQVARQILDRNALYDVKIERVAGNLTDHYDPTSKKLRLSQPVYDSTSIAAQGVAAHETGHALQHKTGYAPLHLRSKLVPLAGIGSQFSWILIMIGALIASAGGSMFVAKLGVLLFATTVLFTLVTLPVEFNASSRAKAILTQHGIVSSRETDGINAVLNAAALTYVAAAVTAMLQLLYWVIRLGLLRNND